MALLKQIDGKDGIARFYWRVSYVAHDCLSGKAGVVLLGYPSKAVRDAGKDGQRLEISVPALEGDRKTIYAALKAGDFAGAGDV